MPDPIDQLVEEEHRNEDEPGHRARGYPREGRGPRGVGLAGFRRGARSAAHHLSQVLMIAFAKCQPYLSDFGFLD